MPIEGFIITAIIFDFAELQMAGYRLSLLSEASRPRCAAVVQVIMRA